MSSIWVWIETKNGEMSSISKEAIGAARTIGEEMGEDVVGILLGEDVETIAETAFDLGVDEVMGSDDETFATFRVSAAGPMVASMAKEHEPAVILVGASVQGSEIAAWVAAELDAGLIADAIALEVDDETVKATCLVYNGKLLSTSFITDGTQLITLRNRAFAPAESTGDDGDADWEDAVKEEDEISAKITNFAAAEGGVSLNDANIIVSGGRGVGSADGFAPVRELADVLGAAVGASRAAVDAGWIPYEHQVGQTGKSVAPDLYIASGISGAIQHQAGMRGSKVIVAVNKDADAPIFKIAQYGIVADLFDVLPALTEAFKERL